MQLFYIMDPMCSWCWAFSPSIDAIKEHYPQLSITYLLGGLAEDSDQPMPEEQRDYIQSIWQSIEAKTGTQFNYEFWTRCEPRRSTWPACRAVITAEALAPGSAAAMTRAIQLAYYLNAQNPSNDETLIGAAKHIGLEADAFQLLLHSPESKSLLDQHRALGQKMDANGFPALRLVVNDQVFRVSDGYMPEDKTISILRGLIEELN